MPSIYALTIPLHYCFWRCHVINQSLYNAVMLSSYGVSILHICIFYICFVW